MNHSSKRSSSRHEDITLKVLGMSCASCVGRVEAELRKVAGVQDVVVNLATEQAKVSFNEKPLPQALVNAVENAGYSVAESQTTLAIEGMSCASCVGRVERALASVPGVTKATVNLASQRADVSGYADVDELVSEVAKVGYSAHLIDSSRFDREDEQAAKSKELSELKSDLIIAGALTLPVFILEMGSHLIPGVHHYIARTIGTEMSWYIQCALVSLVLAIPGRRFFRQGVPALLRGAPDMNSLVVVGTSAAWAYSIVATFFPAVLPAGSRNVYYEAAAVIITLILLGRLLEARAKGRTSQAIQRLMGLQVKTARIKRGEQSITVSISEVKVGDLIEIRPGESIPVDAEVVDGESYIDESMVTGEPVPVLKQCGSSVVGGTINQNGALTVKATAVGNNTLLAQIIRMVEGAQGSKLPIQNLVDKVTLWFVPAVIGLSLVCFAVWLLWGPSPALSLAVVNAVAVLIIACPCAMGLATPTSIMVGTGKGAELGILYRRGEALQQLKDANVIAMDKTGTLTKGKPVVTDFDTTDAFETDHVLGLIAAVEAKSEHPIAQAIVAEAIARNLALPEVTGFDSVTGFGVKATLGDMKVEIGADRFMNKLGIDVSRFTETATRLGNEGKSPLYAAIDGKLAGIVAVSDPVKEDAAHAVSALHNLGIKVVMITGDNARTANAVARQLDIDSVVAEVLPEGKIDTIKQLKQTYGQVAFVGDGINDAPALAEADVGIAIGTGTDIAIEAADIVLMSGSLQGVPNAIALSASTLRNIKQNLFWAFSYNTILIPVAAGILYPAYGILLSPVFAAGAMALSSLFVVGNALTLRRFRPLGSTDHTALDSNGDSATDTKQRRK